MNGVYAFTIIGRLRRNSFDTTFLLSYKSLECEINTGSSEGELILIMKNTLLQHGFKPLTLRVKLMLMMIVFVSIPIISTGYVLELKGRDALLEEKSAKLFGLAKILDSHLVGDFDTLLKGYKGNPNDRLGKIRFLNDRLRDVTDLIAEANPGVGIGYYVRELNASITYGPSRENSSFVEVTIPPSHPGWKVMETGQPALESGHLVRGHILDAMWPIIREGKVIGFVFANEFTAAVEQQARAIHNAVMVVTTVGLILSLSLSFFMARQLTKDVGTIKNGLKRMQHDMREPIKQLKGEMGEIVAAVNDMARALLNARSLNENILWSIADGVITVDVDRNISSINPAGQKIIGVSSEDVVGQPYKNLLNEEISFTSLLLDTIQTGNEYVGVFLDVPFRNRMLYLSVSTNLLKDGIGKVIGGVAIFKDISETRQLQKQVMRADRLAALGELVAGIAHDIRNPLTSIRGFVQYLQKTKDPQELQEYAPLIIREVDGLNRIIGELLEFAKPHPPRYRLVQVNGLIQEALSLIKARAEKQGIRIDMELDPSMPSIEADGEQLKQVLLNLLINACQAIPGQGRIVLTTATTSSGQLTISIIDDGVGIAPENLDKVFDPFFSTKPSGTGLGLAVVQRIMNSHGGDIEITSETGKGTTVTIQLPFDHKVKEAS